ncbi:MAG: hypothetical protein C4K49_04895 [Candidatus Thorarchaeota archaeon]|nr:MAG: hypothetical protein C4K49_04895 [Candidatus Thorarchaeota archaeon]
MSLPEKRTEIPAASAGGSRVPKEPSKEQDIIGVLRSTQHHTCQYPSGITVGVRLQAIPGTGGVHLAVVFVLDMRSCRSGKSDLGLKAEVLDAVTRPLARILTDVGLDGLVRKRAIATPWGRVRLELLRSLNEKGSSMMHETRTVYVVAEGVRPLNDLGWLTDQKRIVRPEEFSFACQSDMRSIVPDVRRGIAGDKWSGLQNAVERGWYGVLSSVFSVAGALTCIELAITGSGGLLLPLLLTAAGGIAGAFLLAVSRKQLRLFESKVKHERSHVSALGDWSRISKAVSENEQALRLVGDLHFTVTPLMAAAGEALESGNTDHAVSLACSVLDECVRFAPAEEPDESTPIRTSDMGLGRFLCLLRHLGSDANEEMLALMYVGLTAHLSNPMTFGEAVSHIGLLNNSLYDIGVLRFDVKNAIDDLMNIRAMSETAERLGEMLTQPEEEETATPVPVLATRDDAVHTIEGIPSTALRGHEATSDFFESIRRNSRPGEPDLTSATRTLTSSEHDMSSDAETSDNPDGFEPPKRAADIVSARIAGMSGRPSESSAGPVPEREVSVSDPKEAERMWGLDDAEE